jgi:hypothetical protein
MDDHPIRIFVLLSLCIVIAAVWLTRKLDQRRENKTARQLTELEKLYRL